MTHICVGKLTIMGSDDGLSPGRRQAIIWTNAGILLIGPLGTNFSEILIEIHTFSLKKMRLKMSSAKWRPFCLGLNVLNSTYTRTKLLFEYLVFPVILVSHYLDYQISLWIDIQLSYKYMMVCHLPRETYETKYLWKYLLCTDFHVLILYLCYSKVRRHIESCPS